MMFLTLWLSRTLEMMQNDVRTSGIEAFLVQRCFLVHEELFMDVLDENNMFGIHLHTANECLAVCGCGRDEVERFGLFQHYLHVFVNMNNQHVSKQTACFISGSCRMFS